VKMRELRAFLREEGFSPQRKRGSHEMWVNTAQPRMRPLVLCGANGADAKRYIEARAWKAQKGGGR